MRESKRESGVTKRETSRMREGTTLTDIQRSVIRDMVARPGLTLKDYAAAVGLDRSTLSRWVHHDGLFQDALEKARSTPRRPLTAEDIMNMSPEEKEKARAVLLTMGGGKQRRRCQHTRTRPVVAESENGNRPR